MSSTSYFWANLGVLQKVGVWSPFYSCDNTRHNGDSPPAERFYQLYRLCIISFCTWHTFTECFLICYDLHSLTLDELTVSIAYGIQHFLGIVKVYIIINQQRAIVALDNRTRRAPLYRPNDDEFNKSLRRTISLSDKIGYIYWFAVLFTISFGAATAVFVTIKNHTEMETVCRTKLDYYTANYNHLIDKISPSSPSQPLMAVSFERHSTSTPINNDASSAAATTTDDDGRPSDTMRWANSPNSSSHVKVALIEDELSTMNLTLNEPEKVCAKPKRVFPYHVWMPLDAKKSPFFQVYFGFNFLGGFLLVCCILPIDLMVMSYMRYLRFQFEVLKNDLIHLRENSIKDLLNVPGHQKNILANDFNEEILIQHLVRRLKKIIRHQLAIFDFFDKTNDLFTWVLFAQYLGSAIMICGVLYTISSVADDMLTPKFFHVAFFYSGLIFQLYSNCFYGNEVLVLSGGIAESAYFSGWQESGKCAARIKPYIIMIMTQSLHPCKLTAGKFAGVDLETFLKVFKASYTYYTVLVDDGKR